MQRHRRASIRYELPGISPGSLEDFGSVETDLQPTLHGKRFTSGFVTDLNATSTARASGRRPLALECQPQRAEWPEEFDDPRRRQRVRSGAGRGHVRADLVDARAWQVASSPGAFAKIESSSSATPRT